MAPLLTFSFAESGHQNRSKQTSTGSKQSGAGRVASDGIQVEEAVGRHPNLWGFHGEARALGRHAGGARGSDSGALAFALHSACHADQTCAGVA